MRKLFQDGLLVLAAILLTGGTALAMSPTSGSVMGQTDSNLIVKEPVIRAEKPAKAPVIKKAITWHDNPNHCTDAQYIAKDEPFSCIDKPKQQTVVATYEASDGPNQCSEWIKAAGITDIGNAQELIRRESGCNPNAVNPSSGACGVAQELPCGKSGCQLGDGACQVIWMNSYVLGRYGSWGNAVAFHNANNWY